MVYPGCSMCQSFFSLRFNNILYFVYSSENGHMGCFHFLAIMDNTAMIMCVYKYVFWVQAFNSFGYIYL